MNLRYIKDVENQHPSNMAVRSGEGSRMTPEVSGQVTGLRSCTAIRGVEQVWERRRWRTELGLFNLKTLMDL